MQLLHTLQKLYPTLKDAHLQGRYVTMPHIKESTFYRHYLSSKSVLGLSVQEKPIELFTAGSGAVKILMWSQMHGNESTTTKAMADLFNFLKQDHDIAETILSHCTLYGIPILNPDGALCYTRENANGTDLNRDAQNRSQPESRLLRELFDKITPDFCFNLHDQRSIYGVGNIEKSAVVSFLSPAQDQEASITPTRQKSMQLIVAMYTMLREIIPDHIGRYDDTFNLNCVGDTFQSAGVPTLLFEAGHFKNDYQREKTRSFIFYALVQCLYTIAGGFIDNYSYKMYFDIPENKKSFFDILITNIPYIYESGKKEPIALGIQYEEVLMQNTIEFLPLIQKKGDLHGYYGHNLLNYKKEEDKNLIMSTKNLIKILYPFLKSSG